MHDVAVDADGNSIIAGQFDGDLSFDTSYLSVETPYDYHAFVAKIDDTATPVWAIDLGSRYDFLSVHVDGAGNSYVTNHDLLKISSNGQVEWTVSVDSSIVSAPRNLAVDAMGNAYFWGSFTGTLSLGGVSLTSAADSDIFVVKFSSDGTALWARSFGDPSGTGGVDHVQVDSNGDVLATGTFFGASISFGGDVLQSSGERFSYVVKLDPDGNHIWSRSFGSSVLIYRLAPKSTGAIVMSGYFANGSDLGCGKMPDDTGHGFFLAELDSAGACSWAKQFDYGVQFTDYYYTKQLAVGPNDEIFLTGVLDCCVDFGDGYAFGNPQASSWDAFVARFSPTGNINQFACFGESPEYRQLVSGVAADEFGNVLIAGDFFGRFSLGTESFVSAGEFNNEDIFLAKLTF